MKIFLENSFFMKKVIIDYYFEENISVDTSLNKLILKASFYNPF